MFRTVLYQLLYGYHAKVWNTVCWGWSLNAFKRLSRASVDVAGPRLQYRLGPESCQACVISGFRQGVNEIFAVLGFTQRRLVITDVSVLPVVPKRRWLTTQSTLRKIPEQGRSPRKGLISVTTCRTSDGAGQFWFSRRRTVVWTRLVNHLNHYGVRQVVYQLKLSLKAVGQWLRSLRIRQLVLSPLANGVKNSEATAITFGAHALFLFCSSASCSRRRPHENGGGVRR
jgi:hypothetical protein